RRHGGPGSDLAEGAAAPSLTAQLAGGVGRDHAADHPSIIDAGLMDRPLEAGLLRDLVTTVSRR
ncbi:hypothetical protein, partial [Paracoccus sp. SY]|uniref:hypothetical protein n=1 Tax=Paracoccus sp. SY TaxID=1330255 RepID=UPI001960BE1F